MSVCLGYQAVYLDRRSSSFMTKIQLIALALLVVSFSYKVWLKLETVEIGYQIAEARKQTIQQDLLRQELELQYSVATRADLLGKRAQARLELYPAEAGRIYRIVEG